MTAEDEAAKAAEHEAAAAKAAADKAQQDREAAEKETADENKLGEAGKAALEAERTARKEADRARKAAEAKVKEYEDAKLSQEERLRKQAEEGQALAATATDKLRRANLITALAEQSLTGAKAKAAVRLLDGIEFDEDDEPSNLEARMTAAKAIYGEDIFKGATPKDPDFHQGPRKRPEEDEDAQVDDYVRTHFPQTVSRET